MTPPLAMKPLDPPTRLLLGPGPSPVLPEVLQAMSRPIVGHLDPYFFALMDETMEALRRTFVTKNRMTLPISGTGSAGMEASVTNLIEAGDRMVVIVHGYFSTRLAEMARRAGAEVVTVEAPWGQVIDPQKVAEALKAKKTKALGVVHVETSTGVHQPLPEILGLAREHGALSIVDAVTSLGGMPLEVDALGIDFCFSGSQKSLGAPPGLSPITVSERAMDVIRARKTPVRSFYLDVTQIDKYLGGGERAYHHTAPITMVYALHEGLRLLMEEGLEARHRRHVETHRALADGMASLGLEFFVAPQNRPPMINTFKIPAGFEDRTVRKRLLEEEGIEIGGGFGPLAGAIWRVGIMGHGARKENVTRLVGALKRILGR